MSALLDLAERCEKAEAGEQSDVLREAWLALHPGAFSDLSGYPQDIAESQVAAIARRGFGKLLRAGAFIDAALMLVPEGAFWWVGMRGEHRGGFHACCQIVGDLDWREGSTPALALCAAALRALAASDANPPASASPAPAIEARGGTGDAG